MDPSNNNIVIKKDQEGDTHSLYAESSDGGSSIELMRHQKKKSIHKPPSVKKQHKQVSPSHNDQNYSYDRPSVTETRRPKQFSEIRNQSAPVTNQHAPLKDDMFEVFTNPDKKRPAEDSDEEERSMDEHNYGSHPQDPYPHPGGGEEYDEYDKEDDSPENGFNSIEEEKQDYLYKFYRLQAKGVPLNKKFNMNSNIAEMRSEFNRIKRDSDVNASIRFSRRMLMACVTGIEFMNRRYDPFEVKLEGWCESVMENVDDYDNVFERLHDKYASKVSMAPEIELLLSLAGSAFMFHLTNSMFNSMPNLKDIAKQNPDILKNMMQSMSAAASGTKPTQPDTAQPDTAQPDPTPSANGFREMQPPMFDVSNLMSMMQPNSSNKPAPITSFRPIGNEVFQSSRTGEPISHPPQTQVSTYRQSSPSVVSSSAASDREEIYGGRHNQSKNISFSETSTAGGAKRRGRSKIQSTSENTITI